MNVTETSTDGLRRGFRVVVPAADIDSKVLSELNKLAGRVRLPGFRPGKVPLTIMRQRYGKSVLGEVLQETVNEGAQRAISDRNLRPALQPKVEVTRFEEGRDLEYTIDLEVLPEIEPIDLGMIAIERPVAAVNDEAVDRNLVEIARNRKKFEPVTEPRQAALGDQVVIDFRGSLDGVAQDAMSGTDFRLEIGSSRFIPGFEEHLIGHATGDAVTVALTFPEDYPGKEYAGKPAVFEVKIKAIEAPVVLAPDDEFAKEMGFDDLAALRDLVRTQTEGQYARLSRLRAKRVLLDRLAEKVDFPVPAGMVDMEFDQIWRQVQQSVEADDANPDRNRPEDELKAEYRSIAERRVRLGLLFADIGRRENIEVTQEELNQALIAEARRYPGQERQVIEFFRKNPQAAQNLRAPVLEEKVVDIILGRVAITDRTVTPEELARDPDEDDEKPAMAAVGATEATAG
jgi:trigger factor